MAGRKTSHSNPQVEGDAQAALIEGETRVYADMGTLTEPVEIRPILEGDEKEEAQAGPSTLTTPTIPQDHPPAYTADPDPTNERQVLDRAHPRRHGRGGVVDGEYDTLVDTLGIRCSVLEEEIKLKKADREKSGIGELRRRFTGLRS
jgi:hypothetical protein